MATNTYVALDKVTVGTATSSITFNSINSEYTDLIIIGSVNGVSTAADIWYRVGNGSVDTNNNYSWTWMSGFTTTTASERAANNSKLYIDGWGTIGTGNSIIKTQINNYSNTTTYKTILTQRNDAAKEANAQVGQRSGRQLRRPNEGIVHKCHACGDVRDVRMHPQPLFLLHEQQRLERRRFRVVEVAAHAHQQSQIPLRGHLGLVFLRKNEPTQRL
jgi:hypothetical protein